MAQPSIHGRFIWQELVTADTGAAGAFYSKVIGWHLQAPAHGASHYSTFAAQSGPVGGLTRLQDDSRETGVRPHWLPFIGADDVDVTSAAAERLGGKVLRPATDIENIGRYAVLADPQGATFGVYKPLPSAASPARNPPQPGEFAWQELATSDYEAAFKFYGELFGWQTLQRVDRGPAGTYLVFGRDGVQRGGIYKLPAPTPPYWLSYVEVANVDATVAPARDAGGRVVTGPIDVPGGGRIAQLLDPSGALFAVHTAPKAATAKAPAKPAPAKVTGSAGAPLRASPNAPPPKAATPKAAPATALAAPATAPAAPIARVVASAKKKAPAKKAAAKKAAKPAARKTATKKVAAKSAKKASRPARNRLARGSQKRSARGKASAASRGAAARSKTAAKSARRKSAAQSAKRPAKKKARRAAGKASRKK